MRQIPVIARRDLSEFFTTPTAYVVFALLMAIVGFFFFLGLSVYLLSLQQIQALGATHLLAQWNLNDQVISPSLGIFAFVMIVVIPALSARSFAGERASGTIELLLTSPVTMWDIVLGKYLALLVVVLIAVVLGALYPGIMFLYGNPEGAQTLAGLLSVFLYCAALAAVCCFISSLTESQMVAFVFGFIACLVLMVLDAAAEPAQNESFKEVLRYLGTRAHFESGLGGNLRSEDLTYFGVMAVIFLALTHTAIDSLRWR